MKYDLLKGRTPLAITFWIFGIIPWIIYGLIGVVLTRYYLSLSAIPYMQSLFYFYLLFPFFYFPLIYIAVWNSSTLYKKNKLWPILAKIIVVLGVAFLLIGAAIIINQFIHRNDITYQINQEIQLISKNLPIKIDASTYIEKISFNNNIITYDYKLLNKDKADVNVLLFPILMKHQLVNDVCRNTGLRDYLSKGITLSYRYVDKNEAEVSNILIKANDCN